MRLLLLPCAGIIVFLIVVSGTLWSKLRAEQQRSADLEVRAAHGPALLLDPTPAHQRQIAPEATAISAPSIERPEPRPATVAVQPAPERPTQIGDAYRQSDMTARTRVQVWASRLSREGMALTQIQAEALVAAAIAELRRETDESARILAQNPVAADAVSVAQAKLDYVDRQNDTNRRILNAVASQLTSEQLDGLRAQFDEWYVGAQSSARMALERARSSPQ